jgi:hypothetical protein
MQLLKKIVKGVIFRLETRFLQCFAIFDYLRSNTHVATEPTVCGFFQCYKEPKAAIAALASFRNIYPTSAVHMFCDNGFDFSHVAAHFNCTYEYLRNPSGKGDTLFFLTQEKVMSYMQRLLFTAQHSTEDFVMIVEDDIELYRKIKTLKFDWNCVKPSHHFSGRKLTSLLRSRNRSIPWYVPNMYFTGCGGALLRRSFIIEQFSDEEQLRAAIAAVSPYVQKQWNGLPQDAILTALILYFGGTVGDYPAFTEAQNWKYKLRPLLGRVDIVHNQKRFYHGTMSEEENKIFLG